MRASRVVWIAAIAAAFYGGSAVVSDARLRKSAASCLDQVESRKLEYPPALTRAKAMIDCLERRDGWVVAWRLHALRSAIRALPNAPAEFAGEWVSTQPNCTYRILFRREGTFKATPIACSVSGDLFEGSWGVHESRMVWMYQVNGRAWPPDVNRMEAGPAGTFHLHEENGSRTVFRRMDADQLTVEGVLESSGSAGMASAIIPGLLPRRDGVYAGEPAFAGSSRCSYLHFNNDETVTLIPGGCDPSTPEKIRDFLALGGDADRRIAVETVPVTIQGGQVRFAVKSQEGGASFRGFLLADGLRLSRRSNPGGDTVDRAYRFVEWQRHDALGPPVSDARMVSPSGDQIGNEPKAGDQKADGQPPK